MTISLVYVTVSNQNAAQHIGRMLVNERLVACANILPEMTAIYRWEGKTEEATEAVLIMKTRTALVESVIARVRELHDYDCPCLVSWPIASGHDAYLNWIENETKTA